MTIKITALLTSVCAALLYLLGQKFPNDPYFFFISSNTLTGVLRMLLAASLINLAFKTKFSNIYELYLYSLGSILLISFGVAGLVIAPMDYDLFNYLKPMDFVFFLMIGTFYAQAALSYERGTHRLPRLSRPRAHQLRLLNSPRPRLTLARFVK